MAMPVGQDALRTLARPGSELGSVLISSGALIAGRGMPPAVARRTFDGTADQVSAVRRFVRSEMRGHPAVDSAVLVVSELATNAITHTATGCDGGTFTVHLAAGPDRIGLVVADQGAATESPHVRQAGAESESGRGLMVVRELSSLFAVVEDAGRYLVLAVVPAGHSWHGKGQS